MLVGNHKVKCRKIFFATVTHYMKLNSIFSFLVPKENKFFPLLNNLGSLIKSSGEILTHFITSDSKEHMIELYMNIKENERNGDRLVSEIFDELNETFITPFDREDIHLLCERLDDVLDSINSASKRILMFQIKNIPDAAVKMCDLISESCGIICKTLVELKTIKTKSQEALNYCDTLHSLEHDGDELYEDYIRYLFKEEKDSIEIIKLKESMQELESTTDIAYSVGKIIKTIIVKYS